MEHRPVAVIAAGGEPFIRKRGSPLFDLEESLAVFDRLAILDQNLDDIPFGLSLNFIHDLHRFDDTDHGVLYHLRAYVGEGFALRRGGPVKGADHR